MSGKDAVRFAEFVGVESVTIFATPRSARVHVVTMGKAPVTMSVALTNPRPVEVCGRFVDSELFEIQILDQNAEDGGSREFGRYRVELWDEDCPFAKMEVDSFEIQTIEND